MKCASLFFLYAMHVEKFHSKFQMAYLFYFYFSFLSNGIFYCCNKTIQKYRSRVLDGRDGTIRRRDDSVQAVSARGLFGEISFFYYNRAV